MPSEEPDKIVSQLAAWRSELINLDRRNRLLYYKPTQTSTVEFVSPDPSTIVERLYSPHSSGLRILPTVAEESELFETDERSMGKYEIQATETKQDQLSRTLLNLERRTVQLYLDRGLWTLFLGVGMLQWTDLSYDTGEGPVQSPLLMVPVELEHEAAATRFTVKRSDEEIVLNPALCAKLQHDFAIKLELPEDVEETDVETILSAIAKSVDAQAEWEVRRQTVLSTFSFHKEAIYRDLLQNEERIARNPLVVSMILGNQHFTNFLFDPIPEERLDEDAKPEDMVSILDADSSQRRAIVAAAQGKSFVLDGPPGTGKSQTIANIICEQLAAGKNVLFVSEKAAALEVVSKRLDASGLSEFVLELHSHKATRKEVAHRLGASLHSRGRLGSRMTDEELYRSEAERLELSGWAAAMNESRSPLRKSLFEVVGNVARYQSLPEVPLAEIDPSILSEAEREKRLAYARDLARVWGPVERGKQFLWAEPAIDQFSPEEKREIGAKCSGAITSFSNLMDLASRVSEELTFPIPNSLSDLALLTATQDLMSTRPNIPTDWLREQDLSEVSAMSRELATLSETLHKSSQKLLEITSGNGRSIVPVVCARLKAELGIIEQVGESWLPSFSLNEADLRNRADFFGLYSERLRGIERIVSSIVSHFSRSPFRVKIEDLSQLADLAKDTSFSDRPEGHWISQESLEKVKGARDELKPIIAEHTSLALQVDQVILRSAASLDLESISYRFQHDFASLFRWFKGQYWRDKKSLQPYCVSGKVRRLERSLLGKARDLKLLDQKLEAGTKTYSELLGAHWQREKTSLDSLDRAITVADRAIWWFNKGFDKSLLRSLLCSKPELRQSSILEEGIDLGDEISRFKHQITDTCPEFATFATHFAAGELAASFEQLAKPYRSLSDQVASVNQSCMTRLLLGEVLNAAEQRLHVDEAEKYFERNDERHKRIFGADYRADQTNWESIQASILWAQKVRQLHDKGLSGTAAQMILSAPLRHDELESARSHFNAAKAKLLELFRDISPTRRRLETLLEMPAIESLLEGMLSSLDDISEAIEYRKQVALSDDLGLARVIEACALQGLNADSLLSEVDRSILECWIQHFVRNDPRLKNVQLDERQRILQEYRRLDTKLIRSAASRVIEACNRRRPRNTGGSASIIAKEAQKQRRHMPIRLLMEKAGPVIQDIKPCFMMSPLSVSQFLPPDIQFDTVIFDEASQVKPEDAINCIYRGKQLIVAGDEKQLPPTTFFEQSQSDGGEEYSEDAPETFESVLGLCKGSGAFQEMPLLWHYRSRHEHLILFSNYSFYGGRLITFPGSQHEGEDLGVEFFYVPNAIYRRGGARDNPKEARAVAERVLFHLNRRRESTIGIVTLSEPQAFAIDRELDQALQAFPDLLKTSREDRLGGLFVKNLETVQGDERDIIILSIGYGHDESGRFIENFGPLNRKEGWRRLNVAITRARKRVEVVSSIRADEITRGAGGAGQLKKYLHYAGDPANRLSLMLPFERASVGDFESPLEEEVAETIRKWGYDAVAQVGCSEYRIDLGILHPQKPEQFLLGIECDGAMYHSSKVARDRDRLRQQILEGLGWTLHRIWGLAWYQNRKDQEKRLRDAIESALQKRPEENQMPSSPLPLALPDSSENVVPFEESTLRPWTVPYKVKIPTSLAASLYDLHDARAKPALRAAVLAVVEIEGPVSLDVITQRIRNGRGLGRAGSRIREVVEGCLMYLCSTGQISEASGFYLRQDAGVQVRIPVRGKPETEREIEAISDLEIEKAIVCIIADSRAIGTDDLVREISRLFGWQRSGDQIQARCLPLIRQMKWRKLIGELSGSLVPIERTNGEEGTEQN